jgi:hypothetical protein
MGFLCQLASLKRHTFWLGSLLEIDSQNKKKSTLFDLLLGTVQGSFLGPVIFTMLVSLYKNKERSLSFSDD